MAKTYMVTSPVVVVTNPGEGNRQEMYYAGTPLPSFVPADRVKELLAEKHIEVTEAESTPAGGDGVPSKSASKAEWVAYAVSQGVPEAEAEAATRDELVARFTA